MHWGCPGQPTGLYFRHRESLDREVSGLDQGQLRRSPWKQVRRSQLGVPRSRGSWSTLGEQTFCLAVRRSWVRVPPGPHSDPLMLIVLRPQGVLFQPGERPQSVGFPNPARRDYRISQHHPGDSQNRVHIARPTSLWSYFRSRLPRLPA